MSVTVETCASAAEAARALGQGAHYLGGGTIVMRRVNAGDQSLSRLVRSTDPGLAEIRTGAQGISLGAGVTMAQICAHPDLGFLAPAARAVGGPALREMATVGGNLFARAPYGDLAVVLLALGAQAVTSDAGGPRPLEELWRGGRTALVLSLEVPRPRQARALGYRKVARVHPVGAPVISLAAHLPLEGGRIRGARVAFTGMGATPRRATAAERALEGQVLEAATVARAAAVAAEGLEPIDDALATAWYRREVAGVHLRRLLEDMERG